MEKNWGGKVFKMDSKFWRATATLVGTTIGAGIFALPYASYQAGLTSALFWLFALSVITILVNFTYATIVIKTPGQHQLVGLSKIYLGRVGGLISSFLVLIGNYGILLAYLIGIGLFLSLIFDKPESAFAFSLLTFVVFGLILYFSLRSIAELEGFVVMGMIILILLLAIHSLIKTNLTLSNFSSPSPLAFLIPYGVTFGALSSYAIIPEIVQLLGKNNRRLTLSLILGTVIPAILYLIFILSVVNLSGADTSQEALQGLVSFTSPLILKLTAVFGILAMGSSFLALGYVLKDTFLLDFKLPRLASWYLTIFPPLAIFVLGVQGFFQVVEVTGAWLGTGTMILILLLYFRVAANRKRKKPNPPKP